MFLVFSHALAIHGAVLIKHELCLPSDRLIATTLSTITAILTALHRRCSVQNWPANVHGCRNGLVHNIQTTSYSIALLV